MNAASSLDQTIYKATFWSVVALVLAGVLALFLPLDAPPGALADRLLWYSSNLGAFVAAWSVQMVAMLTLSAVLACAAWLARLSHPLSAFLAGTSLLIATVAFIIPKFIAIWSIPQMVVASSTVTSHAAVAESLFQILNPSLAFSLFTAFDYLGFWMYGVAALLLVAPLLRLTLSTRIAAISLGLYGVLYHLLLFGVLSGGVATEVIGSYAEGIAMLLFIPVLGIAVYCRGQLRQVAAQATL